MQIIAGKARNLELAVPDGLAVRPTIGRVRKALFDSLGDLTEAIAVDLFAGSGALGLECASRGASQVLLVENAAAQLAAIRYNIERVQNTGVATKITLLDCDASALDKWLAAAPTPDVIFADPPYEKSAEFFGQILGNKDFQNWSNGAFLVWELPDTPGSAGAFLNHPALNNWKLRKYEGTSFLLGLVK